MTNDETSRAGRDASTTSSHTDRRRFLGGFGGAATLLAGGSWAAAPSAEAASAPTTGGRVARAYDVRLQAANRMAAIPLPDHPSNGDETSLPGYIGSYSKGLPHDALGHVDPTAYRELLAALESGSPADFEAITLGSGQSPLTNPQAGLAFDLEGLDPQQYAIPPAPAFSSAEIAGEMVEVYWMALLRDLRFANYAVHPGALAAVADLNRLSDFRGPRQGGRVTPQTLFRDDLPGSLTGPYISQFLWLNTPFGAERVDRRLRPLAPRFDHMVTFADWLAVQNGNVPGAHRFEGPLRYVVNGRDLSRWVQIDVLFQAYFNAALIMMASPDAGGIGCPLNPSNPYLGSRTQLGFGTWGGPFFATLLCEVATRALKAVWFQKWFVHRRLRPEVYGGRVHLHSSGVTQYPLHRDVLQSLALPAVQRRYQTGLLPMAFPEGSPTHPSYGAGHATVAGASVTILKALFDESFVIAAPMTPDATGARLQPWTGEPLTVGGELNKLASNVATGRNIAGVHWRSDAVESLKLGEQVAIEILRDTLSICNEDMGSGVSFTGFDGSTKTVTP